MAHTVFRQRFLALLAVSLALFGLVGAGSLATAQPTKRAAPEPAPKPQPTRPTVSVLEAFGILQAHSVLDKTNKSVGVMVDQVRPGSLAEKAVLKRGAIVATVNGQATASVSSLDRALANSVPTGSVEIVFIDQLKNVNVVRLTNKAGARRPRPPIARCPADCFR